MDVDRFTRERARAGTSSAGLVRRPGPGPSASAPSGCCRLGRRYRAAAADLALARRAVPRRSADRRLERAGRRRRASACTRREPRRRVGSVDFLRHRLLAPRARAAAGAARSGSRCCSCRWRSPPSWAIDDPAAALGVVPVEFRTRPTPGGGRRRPLDRRGGGVLQRDLHQQHPGDVPGDRRRHPARARQRGGAIFNGGFIGALARAHDRERQRRELLRFVLPHGLLELSLHRRRLRGRAAARLGDRRPGPPARAARRCAREARAGDGDRARARCRGWCWPG